MENAIDFNVKNCYHVHVYVVNIQNTLHCYFKT